MTQFQDVKESYGRCCLSKDFFTDFYSMFLASSPEVKSKFAKTNFEKQYKLLRDGITFMIMFAENEPIARLKMEKLGELHNQNNLNVGPRLYGLWLNCLMLAIEKHDPALTQETRQRWVEAMSMGMGYLKSKYQGRPAPQPFLTK